MGGVGSSTRGYYCVLKGHLNIKEESFTLKVNMTILKDAKSNMSDKTVSRFAQCRFPKKQSNECVFFFFCREGQKSKKNTNLFVRF